MLQTELHTKGLCVAHVRVLQVVTLPSSVFTYHLAYRKDIFAQYNLTVPRTWRELLQFSRQYNGTAGMHAFCTVWGPCFQMGVVLLRWV